MATKDTLPDVPGDEMGAADDRLDSLPSFGGPGPALRAAPPAPSARIDETSPADDRLASLPSFGVPAAGPAKQASQQAAPQAPASTAAGVAATTAVGKAAVVEPLRAYLEKLQEPPEAIDRIVAEASRSLTSSRVVVGKLVSQGVAPFEHDDKNKDSPFVVVESAQGNVTLWGVDLPRALQESGVREGTPIVLENPGKRPVTVVMEDRDATGKVIGSHEEIVDRNEWRATSLETLRAAAAAAPTPLAAAATAPQAGSGPAVLDAPTAEHARGTGAVPAQAVPPVAAESLAAAPSQDALMTALRSVVQDVMADSKSRPGRYSAEDLARVAGRLNSLRTAITPQEVAPRADAAAGLLHPVPMPGASAAPQRAAPATTTVAATPGEAAQMRGTSLLGEGVRTLAGGGASLVGATLKGLGRATHAAANLVAGAPTPAGPQAQVEPALDRAASAQALAEIQRLMEEFGLQADDVGEPGAAAAPSVQARPAAVEAGPTPEAPTPLPAVLPRLSEYRIAQVEKAAESFGREQDAFWSSSTKLTALRAEMERVARERGLSLSDVSEKMKPGGDFAELREKFNEAVNENPDAPARKRAMDKALDSFVRQYGRAQEEVLNPEQEGNPHYDRLKKRLEESHEAMQGKTAGVPAFANASGTLEASHFEKLREAVKAIMERVKAVVKEFMAMLKGQKSESANEVEPS